MRSFVRFILPLLVLPAVPAAEPAAVPWGYVHRWLSEQRDRMAQDLETAHATLLARARAAGDEALVEKLRIEPPRPRPHGYGILPEIVDDGPLEPVEARRTTYSLEWLSTSFTGDFRDAGVLAARVDAEDELPLEPWAEEFLRLRKRMTLFEDHLDYHAKWQVEVVRYGDWFGERNRIIERVRELRELEAQGAPRERIEAVRAEVLHRIGPFRPTAGLRLTRRPDGARVLGLRVSTDIDDDTFLETTRRAVEEAFSTSAAARSLGFALELEWRRITPRDLYPDGPPARGTAIDVRHHADRFPAEHLVLTTGAQSTHAWTGRSVLLGPGTLARRTLAHEFGHLLGFDDAYLRGYEGDPGGTYGAVFIEWVGLRDDLMGNPAGGAVTAEMIETLISAYGEASGEPGAAD
jgi:hypothetical protein